MTLAMNKPGRVYCITNFCRGFKQSAQTIVLFLRKKTGLLVETQTGIERVHVVKRDGCCWVKHGKNTTKMNPYVMTSSIIGPCSGLKKPQNFAQENNKCVTLAVLNLSVTPLWTTKSEVESATL